MHLLFLRKNSSQRKIKNRRTHKNGRCDTDPEGEEESEKIFGVVLYIFEILKEFILFLSVFVLV